MQIGRVDWGDLVDPVGIEPTTSSMRITGKKRRGDSNTYFRVRFFAVAKAAVTFQAGLM